MILYLPITNPSKPFPKNLLWGCQSCFHPHSATKSVSFVVSVQIPTHSQNIHRGYEICQANFTSTLLYLFITATIQLSNLSSIQIMNNVQVFEWPNSGYTTSLDHFISKITLTLNKTVKANLQGS